MGTPTRNTVKHPPQKVLAGGKIATSEGPPLQLIPTLALERLAERFALGIERKGDKAWNALSSNQEAIGDKELILDRLGHIIHHALKLRDKVAASDIKAIADDDDAGAIAWGGVFLLCAIPKYMKGGEST